ncbi:MAG: hypothetical protein HKN08_04260, partial [Gammaproteobacteria bacterium]|nr:hypothetical protein [Gammaproteobacteria bacterium]
MSKRQFGGQYMRSIIFVLLMFGMTSIHAQGALDQYQQTLDQYCITCHNETLKTANLM